jgi:uncharacterized OsmC-like protein
MGLMTLRAVSELGQGGMVVDSEVRGFKITADEPKDLGGTDQGMNPVEMLLAALGSCQCMTVRFFAAMLKIELTACRVELEGDIDLMGFLSGDGAIRPGFQKIRSVVHLSARGGQEKLDELMSLVEKRCPVGDTLTHGTAVETRLSVSAS